MREAERKQFGELWGRHQSTPFLLISKHNLDLGTKGERRLLLEDLLGAWREAGGKPRGARSGLFSLLFVFLPKQGRPATGILLPAPLLLPS